MVIPVPSNKGRFTVRIGLTAFRPMQLGIYAYDPSRPHTHYFRRCVTFRPAPFSAARLQREIHIPLPVSPKNLEIELINKNGGDDQSFQVDSFKIDPMPPAEIWATPERHRFMDFAIGFAQKAGHAPIGFYSSPDNEFLIQYLDTITDQQGEELVTPARIHRLMPRVQLSRRMFRQFSIPVRVAILSHEGCHFFRNTRSEKEADLCGIRYYLDYGFPAIEAVYAATKVFLQHPESVGQPHVTRTRDIIQFIDEYKAQRNTQKIL